ncbi:MAG: DNA polymerase III subunit delta' [Flavobacteriales bacterium]|nr:MAG: DNA polymerase III subunit delta' [Flavobacteriales bacterium]
MYFKGLTGHQHIINHLQKSTENGRIPHAQLFVGSEGVGVLNVALAYASFLICKDKNEQEPCFNQCKKFQHPDLHFAFPTATNEQVKSHPVSSLFLKEWREFLTEQPYGTLFDWYQVIGIENKQGQMGVDEASEIVKALQLKPYEGTYQVMIIWMPEKMNTAASNKLLKLIEEPPNDTVFILVTANEEQIIGTIRSRCQTLHFGMLSEVQITKVLEQEYHIKSDLALKTAHQAEGKLSKALRLLQEHSNETIFEEWLITWIRTAFQAKGNPSVVNNLIAWANQIAGIGREPQKQFLNYCIQFFRQALLLNYGVKDLVYLEPKTADFKLEKFAPFVHNGNILDIIKALEDAIFHIERNGNAKIILLDMAIKMTRFLHAKEEQL